MASFYPRNDRPVYPGQSDSYTVSYRFAPSGTATSALAADAYNDWAAAWPPALQWTDRRAIGTVYLASSPSGNPSVAGGYPNNPRRYFNDSNAADFDVRTVSGLARFQTRILQQAEANVQNLTQLNARPIAGQTVSGTITITAQILNVTLDAAGSYLLVDGNEIGTARVSSSPYTYSLNTANLANGMHTLQIRAHDTSNNTLLSNPIVLTTRNTKPPVVYPISLTYPTAGQSVSRTTSALGRSLKHWMPQDLI